MNPCSSTDQGKSAQLAQTLFPGRSMLKVGEVAAACGVDNQHITNLVESGDLLAIDLRTSKPAHPRRGQKKHKSFRQLLRIPSSAFDDLVARRNTV